MAIKRANFDFSSREDSYTHNCFRYPAKFHPPVAAQLIKDFAKADSVILDPFCGSGTLNLEADLVGLRSFGIDCDPLAIFIARAKTQVQKIDELEHWAARFVSNSTVLKSERVIDIHEKLSPGRMEKLKKNRVSPLPPIPNLFHWYHPLVAVELAKIRDEISQSAAPSRVKSVLWLTFASIIRAVSYADPVPVSGLEVTSHMRSRINAGYKINVADLYKRKLNRNLFAFKSLSSNGHKVQSNFSLRDSTKGRMLGRKVDLVITSPPYQGAVDYYRRHTLEMYWLGLVKSPVHRRTLIDKYVGRNRVAKKSSLLREPAPVTEQLQYWLNKISLADPHRALDMRHYFTAMHRVIQRITKVLSNGGKAILVVGDSQWNGHIIPTHELLVEIAKPMLALEAAFSYKLKNRHMSYSRRNGADIDEEVVLIMGKGG